MSDAGTRMAIRFSVVASTRSSMHNAKAFDNGERSRTGWAVMAKRKYHHLSADERMHFHLVRAFYAWALGDAWEAYRQQCYALAALRDVNAFRLTTFEHAT
jgi:hypothetical protein